MNKRIVIGSKAMKYWYPDFPRVPMDTDVIISKIDLEKSIETLGEDEKRKMKIQGSWKNPSIIIKWEDIISPIEYLFSEGQKSLELILDQFCDTSGFAIPEVLYSLKKAHINFPIKFDKHIKDLQFLRGKLRIKKQISMLEDLESENDLLDSYPALTHLHFIETEKRLGELKTPKMNQTGKEFFGKSKKFVKSYYSHDDMHLAIADMHKGYPIYKDILKDRSEVETDFSKWKMLHVQKKIWAVMEEVYVIALERKILPGLFEEDKDQWKAKKAFDWALMRVCTTLCDGFFREFAVRAYQIIQNQYDQNFVQKFFINIQLYDKEEDRDTVGSSTTN